MRAVYAQLEIIVPGKGKFGRIPGHDVVIPVPLRDEYLFQLNNGVFGILGTFKIDKCLVEPSRNA